MTHDVGTEEARRAARSRSSTAMAATAAIKATSQADADNLDCWTERVMPEKLPGFGTMVLAEAAGMTAAEARAGWIFGSGPPRH